jgi:hypothetical protein
MMTAVPNTYAAGQAMIRVKKKPVVVLMDEEPQPAGMSFCECGQRKMVGRLACDTCIALDADPSLDDTADDVLTMFKGTDEWSVKLLAEHMAYKYAEHIVRRACRRLLERGDVTRRRTVLRAPRFVYRRAM